MDLHEELERRARLASAAAAERLGAASVGDALVALVGRRRRRQAAVVTGTSAACVAALVGGVFYLGPWGVGTASPAAVISGAAAIDASTPLAPAQLTWAALAGDRVPAACGDAYTATPGATRHVDDPERWPVSVTASASLSGGNDGILTVGKDFLSWNVKVAPEAAAKDLSVVVFDVVERDGVVVGVGNRGQDHATSRTPIAFEALLPGSCGDADVPALAGDGAYTFHLWAQVVDAGGVPVATVIDPGGPVKLKVEDLDAYWARLAFFASLPDLPSGGIECGMASPVEGREWDSAGYSEELPAGVAMPGWSSSLAMDDGDRDTFNATDATDILTIAEGTLVRPTVTLDAALMQDTTAAAQAFGVVDGRVVAVGKVVAGPAALGYSEPLDFTARCGISKPGQMDVYVLELALADQTRYPQGAVVFRLGPIAVAPILADTPDSAASRVPDASSTFVAMRQEPV